MESSAVEREDGWPSGRVRLTLLAGFGGLLALMVIADLGALHLARKLHNQEEKARQSLLARGQSLYVLSSSIQIYNNRIQQYVLSEDAQSDDRMAQEFAQLQSEITASMQDYPQDRRPEEQALLETFQKVFAEQQEILEPILSWSRDERRRQALQVLDDQVLPQLGQISEAAQEISLWNTRQLQDADRTLFTTFVELQRRQTQLLITALIAGLLLSTASAFYILRLGRQRQQRYQELARSRGELAELSARLVEAQESERRKISRELHDEVGQSLGALLVDVGRLSALIPAEDTQAKERLSKIQTVARQTVDTVRDIALLLRPSMLDDLGLTAALEWQGREVSRRTEMEVEVQSDAVPENLSEEYKLCIYRFVQESLNNASRHSSAKNARVTLEQTPDRILVSVNDDGRGFNPQRERGLGILGLEERVKRLGGVLSIESKLGQGTTVKADLPLALGAVAQKS